MRIVCKSINLDTHRLLFLAPVGRSLLSVLAHLTLGRHTLSSGMISSGYFVEKGIVARTEEVGEEAVTSPGNTGIICRASDEGPRRLHSHREGPY